MASQREQERREKTELEVHRESDEETCKDKQMYSGLFDVLESHLEVVRTGTIVHCIHSRAHALSKPKSEASKKPLATSSSYSSYDYIGWIVAVRRRTDARMYVCERKSRADAKLATAYRTNKTKYCT